MADDKPEDAGLAPDSGRGKRPPPTIDLEATEVSTQPQDEITESKAEPQSEPEQAKPESTKPEPEPAPVEAEAAAPPAPEAAHVSSSVSPWVIAPLSGAVAAALVIAVGWMLGWPAVQAPPTAPQVTAATVDELTGRIAGVEAKVNKAADPSTATRLDALEKSAAALRAQTERLASAVNEMKSAPSGAATVDLSALNGRIAEIERSIKADRAALAQQSAKIADTKPADDRPLRRVIAATLLDVAVRHGDAYAAQLEAAKAFAPDPAMLKPLDTFAATGLPSPVALSREFLNIVPKLSPPAETQTSGSGIIDRLQASASKLVRIERTDAVGNDRGAIVARATAAALRNDYSEARREVKTLSEADREPVKAWLDKTDAREAALAASRKLADEAMADLAKPAQ